MADWQGEKFKGDYSSGTWQQEISRSAPVGHNHGRSPVDSANQPPRSRPFTRAMRQGTLPRKRSGTY